MRPPEYAPICAFGLFALFPLDLDDPGRPPKSLSLMDMRAFGARALILDDSGYIGDMSMNRTK